MQRRLCTNLILCGATCLALLGGATESSGQDPELATSVLSISPAAEPTLALRYRLLPTALELKAGSAAPIYMRITKEQSDAFKTLMGESVKWLEMPLADLPRDEVREYLRPFDKVVFQRVRLAAIRDRCDWEYPIGEVPTIYMLLPDLQELRAVARLVTLKVRLEIAEGRFNDAIATFRDGFALARHTAKGPFLVHQLVAVAIANMLVEQMHEFVSQPNAPNMYWALTTLPRPLIDIRKSVELDLNILELTIPALGNLNEEQTPEQWQNTMTELFNILRMQGDKEIDFEPGSDKTADRMKLLTYITTSLPQAKRRLIDQFDYPADDVEAMSIAQTLVLSMASSYPRLRDEQYKWFSVPFHQAAPRISALKQRLEAAKLTGQLSPMSAIFINIGAAYGAPSKLERAIAALRTVEAIRMYADENDGKLPKRLDDIRRVPIPIDPTLGRPFEYEFKDHTATLAGAPPEGLLFKSQAFRYHISVRPKD